MSPLLIRPCNELHGLLTACLIASAEAQSLTSAAADGVNVSDEAGLVERIGHDVRVVLGSERNIKITRPADMELARFYLERERNKK